MIFKPIFTVNTLPPLKSIFVVVDAVIVGIVNLNLLAEISPDTLILVEEIVPALILVAVASPKIGVTKLGLTDLTILPVPVVVVVLKTPPAVFVTKPATFSPDKVKVLKVGEAVIATDCPMETVLPPLTVTPNPATTEDCFELNKFQSVEVKYPLELVVAAGSEMAFEVLDKGALKVNGFSKSIPEVAAETIPDPFAFKTPLTLPAPP